MKCNHLKFNDLGTHWQCINCNRVVNKQTVEESQKRIDKMIEDLERLQWQAPQQVKKLANRLDNVQAKLNKYKKNNPYNN